MIRADMKETATYHGLIKDKLADDDYARAQLDAEERELLRKVINEQKKT